MLNESSSPRAAGRPLRLIVVGGIESVVNGTGAAANPGNGEPGQRRARRRGQRLVTVTR
jgi:hypothetical protein